MEIATLWAFDRAPALRWALLGWRVDMHWLLYSFLALCLSVMWDQVRECGEVQERGVELLSTLAPRASAAARAPRLV